MPNEISLSAMLNKTAVYTTGQPQLLYALVEVRPGQAAAQARLPLNFSLVLDKSASMAGAPIQHLREAVRSLIDQTQAHDILSIVAFDQSAAVVVEAQEVRDKDALKWKVSTIGASHGTQMSAGMKSGLQELTKHAGPGHLSRMVLFTDGATTNEKACRNRADEAAQQGIPIIALGLGTEWNEDLLQDIAARTGGSAYYVRQPQDLAAIFQDVWQSIQVTATNLRLTLRLTPGVQLQGQVWQVVPEIKGLAGDVASVPLADLEPEGQSLIVELLVPGRPPGLYRMAQVEVSYDVPSLGLWGHTIRADLVIQYTPDPRAAQWVNPQVMNLAERLDAFKLQQRAMRDLLAGNPAEAARRLLDAATRLLNLGETDLAQTYQAEAARLAQEGQLSEVGKKTIKLQSSKTRRLKMDEIQ